MRKSPVICRAADCPGVLIQHVREDGRNPFRPLGTNEIVEPTVVGFISLLPCKVWNHAQGKSPPGTESMQVCIYAARGVPRRAVPRSWLAGVLERAA